MEGRQVCCYQLCPTKAQEWFTELRHYQTLAVVACCLGSYCGWFESCHSESWAIPNHVLANLQADKNLRLSDMTLKV